MLNRSKVNILNKYLEKAGIEYIKGDESTEVIADRCMQAMKQLMVKADSYKDRLDIVLQKRFG